jgi:glucokinase
VALTDPVERPVLLGFDLGGTKLLGIVLDATTDQPIVEHKVPTPPGDVDAVVDAIEALASELVAAAATATGSPVQPIAAGLGAPGLVDRSGVLRYGANLPGVVDGPLGERLTAALGVPVAVDNDATCAAWAEHAAGAGRGVEHSITITLGTGIGAGIVAKGQVLRGTNGFAGEPGHMVLDPNGPRCPCGRRGCWERYGSGSGLGWLAREAAAVDGGLGAVIDLAGGSIEAIRGEHVTAAAAAGDAEALVVMARLAWWVALGISNVVNLLDPQVVILGGGLVDVGELLLDPVREAYSGLVYGGPHRPVVDIVPAALGSSAGARGAALLARDRLAPG